MITIITISMITLTTIMFDIIPIMLNDESLAHQLRDSMLFTTSLLCIETFIFETITRVHVLSTH